MILNILRGNKFYLYCSFGFNAVNDKCAYLALQKLSIVINQLSASAKNNDQKLLS